MNDEFEKHLSRQSFRPIPQEWRQDILRPANAASAESPGKPWWHEWLWPCPQAWGGLAAAWALVFVLHAAAPSDSANVGQVPPMNWQTFALLQHEMEMIAQAPDSAPPSPAHPPRRSSRSVKQNIG
jgi:hypothetical protein